VEKLAAGKRLFSVRPKAHAEVRAATWFQPCNKKIKAASMLRAKEALRNIH
jgi:hypothetical protein